MKGPYPELADSVPRIQTVIREEEERFLRNLENGLSLLEDVFRKTKAAGANAVAGADLFELHATYGIPIEVTESLAAERNLAVDRAGFEAALKVHGEVSRGQAEAFDVFATGPLDSLKEVYAEGSAFLGYETTEARGKVIGIVAQGKLVDRETVSPANAPAVVVVLDRTPFYGESGGQVGDTGELRGESFRFQVEDTKRENDFVLHVGRVVEGCLDNGATVHAVVDAARRQAIKRAHTATHVLHHALQKHLGKHAQQAGSKVEPDRLRFDFSNPGLVGRDLLRQIEDTVNEHILTGEAVSWKRMPLAEAKAKGAMALFGEKYPEVVRVVELGAFSRELCGGTHLDHVGQIGGFRLVGEESVAAGTRRITAVTGLAAFLLARQQEDALARLGAALKVPVGQVVERVESLLEELKSQRKELATRKAQSGTDAADGRISAEDLLKRATQAGETRVVVAELGSAAPDELRQMIDVLRRKSGERLAVLLASVQGEKVQLVAGLTPDLVARGMHAGNLLKVVAPIVGGGGGGRPDLAQAGGKDPSKVAEALEAAARLMQEQAARP
jgi:alanyl-tRNA synthetase